jgi:glutamine synthetase
VATDLERFVEAEGRAEMIAEVRRRIDAEGIQYLYYQFPSVTGRIMGKGVPAKHWEKIAGDGFQLVYGATANLFTDRHGNYIGYGPEAAELVGIPEPETFQPLPWDAKVARVWCQCFRNREEREDPGAFLTSDCRGNLKRLQAEFEAATGLHLRAGTEPEMMWLKLKEDGTPDVQGVTKPYCYHIDQFSELQPIIHKVVEYANAMGLDMIQGDHEDAPGQIELNFNFGRAEATADNLSTYRQVCNRSVASSAPSRASCRSRSWASRRTAATTTSRSGRATRTPSCPTPTTARGRARSVSGRSAASSSTSAR